MMNTEQASDALDTLRWSIRFKDDYDRDAFQTAQENIWTEFKEYLASISPDLNEVQREVVYAMAAGLLEDMDPSAGNEIDLIGRTYEKAIKMMDDVANAQTVQFDQ